MSLSEYLTYCDLINKKNFTNICDVNLISNIKIYIHLNLKKKFEKDSLICSYLVTYLLTNLFPEIRVKQKDFSLDAQEKTYVFLVDIKNKHEVHKFLISFFLDIIPKTTKKIKFDNKFFIKIPLTIFKELEIFLNIKEFNFITDLDVSIEFYTKNKQKLNNNNYNLIPFFWING